MNRFLGTVFTGLTVLLVTGCAILPKRSPESIRNVRRDNVPRQLELAEEEIAAGDYKQAVERLIAVRKLTELRPEIREQAEALLDRGAQLLLEKYEDPQFGSKYYEELYQLELPVRLRARAGVLAAEEMIVEGSRLRAFRLIKKIDKALPTHPERAKAGEVLAKSGLSMLREGGRYLLFFKYRSKGVDALEYLVLNYPLDPHCAEAYAALADFYEEKGDIDLAIDRRTELLLYHPESPYSIGSEARLPYLRLKRLKRVDYDRRELVEANREVERWLARYPGNELEPWVRSVGRTCEARLAENDLILARYYDRIDVPFGTRMHATRALETAQNADLAEAAEEARALLASLPPEETEGDPTQSDPEASFLQEERELIEP